MVKLCGFSWQDTLTSIVGKEKTPQLESGILYQVLKSGAGETARLTIPANLAYGNKPVGTIPGGSVLVFDVELIAINS